MRSGRTKVNGKILTYSFEAFLVLFHGQFHKNGKPFNAMMAYQWRSEK